MIRLAELAAEFFPQAHIIEMHAPHKRDSPSGTAIATAEAMGTSPAISSIRLPGVVAHHEVVFGASGEYLTIRTTPRRATPLFPECSSRWTGCLSFRPAS